MIKTYREVLQNIRPGETWESIGNCNIKSISYIDKEIRIEFDSSAIYHALNDDAKFRLKKEEVEFEDAIKALKEGKIIESCETLRLCKMDERLIGKKIILTKAINSSVWADLYTVFKSEEIFGKWYIYNEEEI